MSSTLNRSWLDGSTEYKIGGRDTDISQIAHSLDRLVKQAFPMNQ